MLRYVPLLLLLIAPQDLRLPRDPDKLVARAQQFWAAMTSNQRFRALEFVRPERRDLFLSGTPMPALKATLAGLDLTPDVDRASLRVTLEVFSKESASGFVTWTITDKWTWKDDNWYLDVERPPDVFPHEGNLLDLKKIREDIDKNFQILRSSIDLGTLTDGQHLRIEVPIKYTGTLPLSLELGFPNPLINLESGTELTSTSNNFPLLIGVEDWEGPFTMPLSLKVRYQDAAVERSLVVKGNVFVPVAFRQVPPNGPIEEGREFSVFIRNNTDQEATIRLISVDAKLDVTKRPRSLQPHEEGEVVLKLRPGQTPDRLYLYLETPVQGRDTYTYRFRTAQR